MCSTLCQLQSYVSIKIPYFKGVRIAAFSSLAHNLLFSLELESTTVGVYHMFNFAHLIIWLTLIVQVRFDDQAEYFKRIIYWAYITLFVVLVVLAIVEALMTIFTIFFLFHIIIDGILMISYCLVGYKILQSLRIFAQSNYEKSKRWISK